MFERELSAMFCLMFLLHSWPQELLLKMLSGYLKLLIIIQKLRMILQNVGRRIVGNVLCNISLAFLASRLTLENVVWIFDTFDDNIEIKKKITKYLEENCWQCSV